MPSKNNTYDMKAQAKENNLKPHLTDEFLSILAEAARTCGWSVDHHETVDFVVWCFSVAGKEPPDLTAYDYSEEN